MAPILAAFLAQAGANMLSKATEKPKFSYAPPDFNSKQAVSFASTGTQQNPLASLFSTILSNTVQPKNAIEDSFWAKREALKSTVQNPYVMGFWR